MNLDAQNSAIQRNMYIIPIIFEVHQNVKSTKSFILSSYATSMKKAAMRASASYQGNKHNAVNFNSQS